MIDYKKLPNSELIAALDAAVSKEKLVTAEVVAGMAEVYARKLHLELGYASLYRFVRQKYGLSEGSTYRRVSAARLSLKHPEVIGRLKTGELTLCAATEAWKAFEAVRVESKQLLPVTQPMSKKAEAQVLVKLSHKSKTEAKHVLASHVNYASAPVLKSQVIPHSPTLRELRLPITKEQEIKFERLKSLLSHRIPSGDAVALFDLMLETTLDKFDPTRIQKRVESRKHHALLRHREEPKTHAKRKIWDNFNDGCAYQNPETGKKCASTWCLDVDHILPKSKGGKDRLENYQLLCRAHNRTFKQDRLL